MIKKLVSVAATITCAALLGWVLSSTASAQNRSAYVVKGEKMFNKYCAACHGLTARGEGPVAKSLKGNLPDLTLLQGPGEKFPFYKVQTAVDGENAIDSHGSREMPVWGTVFRKTSGELQRQADIYALVKYIESIQRGNK